MKITETIERECCQQRDMKDYGGMWIDMNTTCMFSFCIHCGQLYKRDIVSSVNKYTPIEITECREFVPF